MNDILKPTLEHIALINVTAALWNQADLKDLLAKCYIPSNVREFNSQWYKVEDIAVKKVAKLPLPNQMKEKILCFIKPVGFQIAKWKQFHDRGTADLPYKFCWTPQGTIDEKKTAEVMIKDKSIDITSRYELACIFCLEDDIPKLWEEMPEGSRKSFYNQEDAMHVMQKELVVLWTYQINEDTDKINSMIEKKLGRRCSPYQSAFQLAAIDGNKVATEYFLQKLTAVERANSLVKTAASVARRCMDCSGKHAGFLRETYIEILCFLLSQLDEDQKYFEFILSKFLYDS